MFNDEIEMTLECAIKMRKHLVRIMENTSETGLQTRLQYVNDIILEANSMQDDTLAFA